MSSKAIEGFLWFYFFTSVILISSLLMFDSQKSNKISELKKDNSKLEYKNSHLSETLSKTKDSLKYATSEDVLWLSRVLYSETDKPVEMYYIAHIVKNRVETCYHGECSYKNVVLDPYEFSGFNPNRSGRELLMKVNRHRTNDPGRWAAAKQIALNTYLDNHDPTNGSTHFFAQVSMKNYGFPNWAYHGDQVKLASNVKEERLRVYKNVK